MMDARYPSADEIMSETEGAKPGPGAPAEPQADAKGANPLVDAAQTIATGLASMQEKGINVSGAMAAFQKFVQELTNLSGAGKAQEAPQTEVSKPAPMQNMANANQTSGARQMQAPVM